MTLADIIDLVLKLTIRLSMSKYVNHVDQSGPKTEIINFDIVFELAYAYDFTLCDMDWCSSAAAVPALPAVVLFPALPSAAAHDLLAGAAVGPLFSVPLVSLCLSHSLSPPFGLG